MILDVDIGNTRTKWRLYGSSNVVSQSTAALCAEEGVPEQLRQFHIDRVRVACVGGALALERVAHQVGSQWGAAFEVAKVSRGVGGVMPAYQDLTRLGVDRWLLLLAAFKHCKGACVVVSAGSALTADWIDANGRHLGGYIAPGRQKMVDVLKWGVADVLRDGDGLQSLSLQPGASTEHCVQAGINAAVKGFMHEVLNRDPSVPVILAGGDARVVLSLCGDEHKKRIHRQDCLVLDGLAIALP